MNTHQHESSVNPINKHAERLQFSQLIAENRNHFGNFADIKFSPVDSLANDTAFEELTHVGYNPELGVLEAILQIKQPHGYLGDYRTLGSYEYIRFYVDTGSGFEHVGLVAINVHDLPHRPDGARHESKPLSYAASVPYAPPSSQDSDAAVLPLVRAILSWQSIPTNPAFDVAWGNALDCRIPLKLAPTTMLDAIEDVYVEGILPSGAKERTTLVAPIAIPTSDPAPLTLAQRAELYSGREEQVPTHRFAYAEAYSALLAPTVDSDLLASKAAECTALNIDWAGMVGALIERDADATFEELDCVGLEGTPGCERLVAAFRIKETAGYFGSQCAAGSIEYVAFWADWDNMSTFTYLGTVPVKVQDVARGAGEDLCYTAVLPVDRIAHAKGRGIPKVARIRAVLSWAVPPSTKNPNALNFWGNSIDALVCFPAAKAGRSDGTLARPSKPAKTIPEPIPANVVAPAEQRSWNFPGFPKLGSSSRPTPSRALAY